MSLYGESHETVMKRDFSHGSFDKIYKVLRMFPASKLELNFIQDPSFSGYVHYSYHFMNFDSSVKKLSLKFLEPHERDDFLYDMNDHIVRFKNLESLVLDVRSPDDWDIENGWRNHTDAEGEEWSGIQLAPTTIWENFSNLTHLRIKSNWEWRSFPNDVSFIFVYEQN